MSDEYDEDFALALMMLQGYCEYGKEALEQLRERVEQLEEKAKKLTERDSNGL